MESSSSFPAFTQSTVKLSSSEQCSSCNAYPVLNDTGNISSIKLQSQEMIAHTCNVPAYLYQLSESDLPIESDSVVCWLARFPLECHHPRSIVPLNTVSLIERSGQALVIRYNERLNSVFEKLICQGFSSAPVIDTNNEYCGFIDLLDITWYIIEKYTDWKKDQKFDNISERDILWKEYIKLADFNDAMVSDILYRPGWEKRINYIPVHKGFSTLYAMELMMRINIHRLALLDSSNKILNILTQSMIISLIAQNIDRFPTIKNIQVHSILECLNQQLLVAKETDKSIDVFKKLVENNIRGMPIINDKGVLIDNISVRDLRSIGGKTENYYRLWMNIKDFKDICRNNYPNQTPSSPITVTRYEKFEDVLKKMQDGNIHRIYVVNYNIDQEPIPAYVITQRDVLRFILHQIGLTPTTVEHT